MIQHACALLADEIDAIGKARGRGGGDAGTRERESGLLQLLYEMDGFNQNDKVLVCPRGRSSGWLAHLSPITLVTITSDHNHEILLCSRN